MHAAGFRIAGGFAILRVSYGDAMPPVSAPAAGTRTHLPMEALLRAVMHDSDAGILVLDPRTRVRALNPAAERLLGVRAEHARSRPGSSLLRTVVAGDDPVQDGFRAPRLERETVLINAEGEEFAVVVRGFRLGRPPWL